MNTYNTIFKHKDIIVGCFIVILIMVTIIPNRLFINRLIESFTLWTADQSTLINRFSNFGKNIPFNPINKSEEVLELPKSPLEIEYPKQFTLSSIIKNGSGTFSLDELFDRWGTTGFIVVNNGKIFDERYFLGHTEHNKWMSFSASKMLVGLLTGLAHKQGYINNLSDPLSKYAPQFKGSAWDKVTIEQALNMTSGVRWDENDISLTGDLTKFAVKTAYGIPFDDFLIGMKTADWDAGSHHNYSSMDTQALGAAISGATGKSLSQYLEETIWSHMGAEASAFWITDDTGREMALSGWNAILRDYARLGMLLVDGKNFKGEQIIPTSWIAALQHPDPEFLQLPEAGDSEEYIRSWHQAYAPKDSYGDYAAVGSYGQIIYINPHNNTVIATHSVNPNIMEEEITLQEQFFAFRMISEIAFTERSH